MRQSHRTSRPRRLPGASARGVGSTLGEPPAGVSSLPRGPGGCLGDTRLGARGRLGPGTVCRTPPPDGRCEVGRSCRHTGYRERLETCFPGVSWLRDGGSIGDSGNVSTTGVGDAANTSLVSSSLLIRSCTCVLGRFHACGFTGARPRGSWEGHHAHGKHSRAGCDRPSSLLMLLCVF